MDGMTLLKNARAAGLRVTADGDRLVVRGPRSEEPVAAQLLANKQLVMTALRAGIGVARGEGQVRGPAPEPITDALCSAWEGAGLGTLTVAHSGERPPPAKDPFHIPGLVGRGGPYGPPNPCYCCRHTRWFTTVASGRRNWQCLACHPPGYELADMVKWDGNEEGWR